MPTCRESCCLFLSSAAPDFWMLQFAALTIHSRWSTLSAILPKLLSCLNLDKFSSFFIHLLDVKHQASIAKQRVLEFLNKMAKFTVVRPIYFPHKLISKKAESFLLKLKKKKKKKPGAGRAEGAKARGQGGAAAGRAGGSRPPKSCGGAARTCIVRGSVDRSWSAGHDAGLGAARLSLALAAYESGLIGCGALPFKTTSSPAHWRAASWILSPAARRLAGAGEVIHSKPAPAGERGARRRAPTFTPLLPFPPRRCAPRGAPAPVAENCPRHVVAAARGSRLPPFPAERIGAVRGVRCSASPPPRGEPRRWATRGPGAKGRRAAPHTHPHTPPRVPCWRWDPRREQGDEGSRFLGEPRKGTRDSDGSIPGERVGTPGLQ